MIRNILLPILFLSVLYAAIPSPAYAQQTCLITPDCSGYQSGDVICRGGRCVDIAAERSGNEVKIGELCPAPKTCEGTGVCYGASIGDPVRCVDPATYRAFIGNTCGNGIRCDSGLTCVSGKNICQRIVTEGSICADRFNLVCAAGLICTGGSQTQDNTCQRPGGTNDTSSPGSSGGSFGGGIDSGSGINKTSGSIFTPSGDTLFDVKDTIINLINNVLIPILFAIAFLVFLFGVYKTFIYKGSDPKAHEEGRMLILYGLIGFAVMVSVWGLVNIVTGSFGLNNKRPDFPTL